MAIMLKSFAHRGHLCTIAVIALALYSVRDAGLIDAEVDGLVTALRDFGVAIGDLLRVFIPM
jgi:hypothetical protein